MPRPSQQRFFGELLLKLFLPVAAIALTALYGLLSLWDLPAESRPAPSIEFSRLAIGAFVSVLILLATLGVTLAVRVAQLRRQVRASPTVAAVRAGKEYPEAHLLALVEHCDDWGEGAQLRFYRRVGDTGDERWVGDGRVVDRLGDGRTHAILTTLAPECQADVAAMLEKTARLDLVVRERGSQLVSGDDDSSASYEPPNQRSEVEEGD